MDARRPVPRLWIRSAEERGERRYENGNTTTTSKQTLANTVLVTRYHFLDVRFNTVRLTNTVCCLAPVDHVITRLRCT